jgi:RNA polymerase sigma factor (sigma-70 family)
MTPPLTTFDDNTLIGMTLAGQPECFAVLMDRHLFAVRRHVLSMLHNTMDADDLIQEVLLKVWRSLSTFRSEASFRTWMTRVAINEVLQWYRRERHRSRCQSPDDLDTFASPCDNPHHYVARAEAAQCVRKALAGLPEKYREVLALRELDQLSMRETAHSIQASIPAVKSRLFRARVLLSASLRRSTRKAQATGSTQTASNNHVENRKVFRPCMTQSSRPGKEKNLPNSWPCGQKSTPPLAVPDVG